MSTYDEVTLANVCKGKVEEAFQQKMAQIMASTSDVDLIDAARKISISIKITPDEDGVFSFEASVGLTMPKKTFKGRGIEEDGTIKARRVDGDPRQMDMEDMPEAWANR